VYFRPNFREWNSVYSFNNIFVTKERPSLWFTFFLSYKNNVSSNNQIIVNCDLVMFIEVYLFCCILFTISLRFHVMVKRFASLQLWRWRRYVYRKFGTGRQDLNTYYDGNHTYSTSYTELELCLLSFVHSYQQQQLFLQGTWFAKRAEYARITEIELGWE
jgi:hypothetical protein